MGLARLGLSLHPDRCVNCQHAPVRRHELGARSPVVGDADGDGDGGSSNVQTNARTTLAAELMIKAPVSSTSVPSGLSTAF